MSPTLRRRVLGGFAALASLSVVLLGPAASTPAQAASTTCGAAQSHSVHTIQYCPVWVPSGAIPVWKSPIDHTVIGHIRHGGDVNWFYCEEQVPGHTYSNYGYSSNWYAWTLPDDYTSSRYAGQAGWVSGIFYAGPTSYFDRLYYCGP